jgi:hypothetical protein
MGDMLRILMDNSEQQLARQIQYIIEQLESPPAEQDQSLSDDNEDYIDYDEDDDDDYVTEDELVLQININFSRNLILKLKRRELL